MNGGVPYAVPAFALNMLCGSGVKSIQLGFQAIRSGEAKIIVAGGQESMTRAPHTMLLRDGVRLGNGTLVDSMLNDGLHDAFHDIHMGVTAENLAEKYGISREAQDAFALESQRRVEEAQKAGLFDKEIVPVSVKVRGGTQLIAKDEYPRSGAVIGDFQKLRPVFLPVDKGTVTAGNASGINDAAAAVLLMSGEEAKRRGVKPLARIVGFGQGGCDPKEMGIGVVPAVRNLVARIGWTLDEVDVFELNEAFAAQSLSVVKELGLSTDKVNVNGGAISLGHPIGASGTRVVVTLLSVMEQKGLRRGVASLCIGGGMGIAVAVERDEVSG